MRIKTKWAKISSATSKLRDWKSCIRPEGERLPHYVFIISQLWLTSHPRGTVVLLDTGITGTGREITVGMPMRRLEPSIRNQVL